MFLTVFDTFLTDRPTDRPYTDRQMKGDIEAPSPELKKESDHSYGQNLCEKKNIQDMKWLS